MKRMISPWRRGFLCLAVLGVPVVGSWAQGVGGGGGAVGMAAGAAAEQSSMAEAISIRKMPRLNSDRDWKQRTPVFVGPSSRSPKEWGVFEVTFDSKALWIDELTVTYHLMLQSADSKEQQPFSLYRLTSRYLDVAGGRGKVVSAVLLPSALLRQGRPVGFAVEFVIDGQVVASESSVTVPFLKDRWWENAQIVDSPRTVKREGYLRERSQTPFGLVDIDENEVAK